MLRVALQANTYAAGEHCTGHASTCTGSQSIANTGPALRNPQRLVRTALRMSQGHSSSAELCGAERSIAQTVAESRAKIHQPQPEVSQSPGREVQRVGYPTPTLFYSGIHRLVVDTSWRPSHSCTVPMS